jgi:hypothetical protein
MIKYRLICDAAHEFEGWFQTSEAFNEQNQAGIITCPVCDSANVRRALMTPNLASPKRRRTPFADNVPTTGPSSNAPEFMRQSPPTHQAATTVAGPASPSVAEMNEVMGQLRQLQRKIKSECRDVGNEFASEARKIHYGESAPENIFGQSSDEEREALADEGIDFVSLPWLPPEH